MDVRQLQALLAIDEWGSFSAAADALDTVQSNISAHVSKLEKELSVTLIDRRAGRLTEEGEVVADRARRILAEMEALETDVSALHSEVRGTVRLGTLSTTSRWLIPVLHRMLSDAHPLVKLVVLEATSSSLESRLLDGSIDLAIGTMPFQVDVDARVLFEEDLLLVVPYNHAFRERETISVAELEGEELLLPPESTIFRQELDKAARDAGIRLTPLIELDGVRMIASLALDGYAPAIIPATALPTRLRSGFQKLGVEGLPRRRVGVALRKSERPAAPARALLELLDDVIKTGLAKTEGIHLPGEQPNAKSLALRDETVFK